jgi:hypothetical protein
MGIKNVLKTAFPFIASAASLGGPIGSMAAAAVGKALGLTGVDNDPDVITKAVAGATPEQMIALREQEDQLANDLKKFNIQSVEDLEKIAADDRASARDMQKQTRSWIAPALAAVFVIGFFVIIGLKIAKVIAPDQTTNDLITTLRDGLIMVMSYYFGSSVSSARKTEILAEASK